MRSPRGARRFRGAPATGCRSPPELQHACPHDPATGLRQHEGRFGVPVGGQQGRRRVGGEPARLGEIGLDAGPVRPLPGRHRQQFERTRVPFGRPATVARVHEDGGGEAHDPYALRGRRGVGFKDDVAPLHSSAKRQPGDLAAAQGTVLLPGAQHAPLVRTPDQRMRSTRNLHAGKVGRPNFYVNRPEGNPRTPLGPCPRRHGPLPSAAGERPRS